jgi:hypothetical protein
MGTSHKDPHAFLGAFSNISQKHLLASSREPIRTTVSSHPPMLPPAAQRTPIPARHDTELPVSLRLHRLDRCRSVSVRKMCVL